MDDDKSADVLLKLSSQAFERRAQVVALLWKSNFALYTAVAAAAWSLHSAPAPVHMGSSARYLWLIVPLHILAAHRFDQHIHALRDVALGYVREVEKLVGYTGTGPFVSGGIWWYLIQVGPTVALTAAAIKLLW